jgi:hypothetical protein
MTISESQPELPRCRRRWHQYRLRTLLVVMLLASIGMSWFAVKLQRARRQREAVEAITKLGGTVAYDYFFDPSDGGRLVKPKPPAPAWMRGLLGEEFFADVVYVSVKNDAALEQIRELPQVRYLVVRTTQVTDDGLRNLQATSQLRSLWIADTSVTDAGLEHLACLTQLQVLFFSGSITDAGVQRLREGLPHCEMGRCTFAKDFVER